MSIPRAPTRGTRRRLRPRKRQPYLWKPITIGFGILFVGITIVVSQRQSSNAKRHKQGSTPNADEKKVYSSITPFTSHPPKPVEFDLMNPRHQCLRDIREVHERLLRPHLFDSVLLVDPAYHSNVGDHMITVGEQTFLGPHSECSYSQAGDFVEACQTIIPKQAHKTAVWHGGGNWGDLWRLAQEPRIQSFESLLSNNYDKILTMPNSWFYKDPATETSDVETITNKIGKHMGKMVFTWREQFSYEKGQLYFPSATNLLVPDIAFQLGPFSPMPSNPMSDLLVLLRDDHESMYQEYRNRQTFRSVLQSVNGAENLSYSIVDWKDRLTRFDSPDIFFTDTSIELLSSGKVVICDRLHAAILAYLSDLPFVYLDQVSGKITKTLSVAMQSPNCQESAKSFARAHNMTHAIELALNMMGTTRQSKQ